MSGNSRHNSIAIKLMGFAPIPLTRLEPSKRVYW